MTRFTQRRDGLSAIVPTPAPVTKLVMPVTKVRTGRPLLGQVAMTAAERQRRRRAALKSGEAAARTRHFTTFRSGLGLRSIRSQGSNRYRLAVKIRQSTVAQRRPELT